MWKAVIADDERIIVKGLKRLIDWDALDIEIVGEAYDGEQLKRVIECFDPDIVLSDIKMPYMTGLEVIQWYVENMNKAQFIFASGFQEFSFAKEAIKYGAVDYLLKPVSRGDLEAAVKKALDNLKQQSTVESFQDHKDDLQLAFENINNGQTYEQDELYNLFKHENIDVSDSFFVGICTSMHPQDELTLQKESFAQLNLKRFSLYNQLTEAFGSRKRGFLVKRDKDAIYHIGVFPNRDREEYVDKYILPTLQLIEDKCDLRLYMGLGNPVESTADLLKTYKEAKRTIGLWPFEQKQILQTNDKRNIQSPSFPEYEEEIEKLFRAIAAKDPNVKDKIEKLLEMIFAMHYGNWDAVQVRIMNFTGTLNSKLEVHHMLPGDFHHIQEGLLENVEAITCWEDMKVLIHDHYHDLIREIYEADKSKDKLVIAEVKDYIRNHYTEDLSIKELAEVACVSPNYFSAMFKKETGYNYKGYLTRIRMDRAIELLRTTDMKTYEIGEAVGYNNVRRFVDAFRQFYNMTPMDYKKLLKES